MKGRFHKLVNAGRSDEGNFVDKDNGLEVSGLIESTRALVSYENGPH